jgi:prepilin-type N-terminal cleavage/methylation domain-containing protein
MNIRRARGFSLVEMVVTIALTAIVFGLGALVMEAGFGSYVGGRNVADADWQGRVALERMTRELHAIKSADTASLIVDVGQITFVDTDLNAITYDRDATNNILRRNGQPLADNVVSLAFAYHDATNQTAIIDPLQAAQVRYVTVTFVVTAGGIASTYRVTVRPRNFS